MNRARQTVHQHDIFGVQTEDRQQVQIPRQRRSGRILTSGGGITCQGAGFRRGIKKPTHGVRPLLWENNSREAMKS